MADAGEIERLRGLEAHLRARIRGQDHAIPRIAAAFCRGALGLASPDRPRGSLLFVGPTGTGKTETAACATEFVFGAGHLVPFDMSEYQDQAAINKLLGAGRDDPGLLGRALEMSPGGTFLFDELEKAHPLVLDLFLQILWEGRITVATGRQFRLTDYFVVFTSNVGSIEAMRMERLSFASVEQAVLRRVEQSLRPELVGRIDERIVFGRLSPDVQREICELEVARETARLRGLGYDLEISREAMEFLAREGYDPHHGARPMRRTAERFLQQAVMRSLFAYGCVRGRVVVESWNAALRIVAT